MKIYLASSWRNVRYNRIRLALLKAGHDVYDFRVQEESFHWGEIDKNWEQWDMDEFTNGLRHPLAVSGFNKDIDAMLSAEVCVLLLPCGRSAHLEGGYFVGQKKPLFILLENGRPELMYLMASKLFKTIEELIEGLEYHYRTHM